MSDSKEIFIAKPGDHELNFVCFNSIEGVLGSSLLPPKRAKTIKEGEIALVIVEAGVDADFLEQKFLSTSFQISSKVFSISGSQDPNIFFDRLESIYNEAAFYIQKCKRIRVGVLVDSLPTVDGDSLFRVIFELRKIADIGCRVVIVVGPEAMWLREEIPEATCIGMDKLLYRRPSSKNVAAQKAMSLTSGIPSLVDALREDQGYRYQRYIESLDDIIRKTLHREITDIQLRLRFAMMLLGSGSFDEVSQIVGEIDSDWFAQLELYAPFFGVDIRRSTFKCAGIFDDDWFSVMCGSIRTVGYELKRVYEHTCEVLAKRGDFRRAGICCSLCAPTDLRCRKALKWGVEFCIAGVPEVVRDSLLQAHKSSIDGYLESEIALSAIESFPSQKKWLSRAFQIREVGSLAFRVRLRHLQLLENIRGIDSGVPPGSVAYLFGVDALSKAMLDHVELEFLLLSGHFTQAVSYLFDSSIKQRPTSIPDALLIRDAALALSFVGENLAPGFKLATAYARQLIQNSHSRRFICYERAFLEFLDIIAGGYQIRYLEQGVCFAEREGDSVTQSVFLLACTVGAMRCDSLIGAHVRAKKAVKISLSSSQTYLAQCALFIDAIICDLLGDSGSLEHLLKLDELKGTIKDLANLLVEIGCDKFGQSNQKIQSKHFYEEAFRVFSPSSRIQDIRWIISLLKSDCGYISTVFSAHMPQAWKSMARSKPTASVWDEAWYLGNTNAVSAVDKAPAADLKVEKGSAKQQKPLDTQRFYFSMLGGFSVFSNGILIETEKLNYRRARSLLGLLVAKEDHIMYRAEIIDIMWPNIETKIAAQRLCEAISGARKVLGAKRLKADVFVCNKLDKTIGLNPETVSCDIDQFVAKVINTKKQEGAHEVVVGLACGARDLYRGDLDCKVVNDVRGVQDRRDTLKAAFADVMVAGARAALANGKSQLSVQLARESYISQPYREDTISIFIESLCVTGRRFEAHETFKHFCADFTTIAGKQPSEELRNTLTRMIDGKYGPERSREVMQ